ncbi:MULTISPECIES: glycosyl hydrolase family 95 catalytic domain-containing protein [Streptomyces violaceusniger group]|uniref:Glycosyl hydrolase family 95 catalytic domain-containing protein n=1 Tax=Streptomyces rhizosphaericus TaxID=114699 RepID=A0ABN1S7D2_9ACTN|nr:MULTISPECIES: hypothetical protein [Streptomyces violaceusniger group]
MKRRTLLTAVTLAPLASAVGTAPARADGKGEAVTRAAAAAADADADWDMLSNLLSGYVGHWTSPPVTTDPGRLTDKMTDGALLGNGELGVVAGGDRNTLRLYLGRNGFWTSPGPQGAHPITLGGLTLRRVSGSDHGTAYEMTQDILNAEVRTELTINGAPISVRTYVTDSADIVVIEVSTSGSAEVRLALDTWTKSGDSRYPAKSGIEGSTLWAEPSTESGSSSQWVARMGLAVPRPQVRHGCGGQRVDSGHGAADVVSDTAAAFDCRDDGDRLIYPVAIGPQGACSEWYFWNQLTNATYAAVTLVSTYEYTPDAAFLKDTLYPYLVQLANFWEDYVGPKEADGKSVDASQNNDRYTFTTRAGETYTLSP